MKQQKELTIKQKALLTEGRDMWYTNAVKEQGIGSICLSDGPAGLCQKVSRAKGVTIASAVHATAFPVPVAMASSWDSDLIGQVGEAIGRECRHFGTQVLLAPGMNLKRSPLCGRNFEYYSEDPLISGKMAAAFVRGVQSTGTGVSLKHFALNQREHNRLYGNSVADERALREIWLRGFEIAVKEGKPYTVMAAYNQVCGTFASQHKGLLTDILRNEWGFDGLVMSDWGGVSDRVAAVDAGCDLEMPGQVASRRKEVIRLAKKDAAFAHALDASAARVAALVKRCTDDLPPLEAVDFEAHAALARRTAEQSAVLLQNDGTLPLSKQTKLYATGPFLEQMRYQGAGSSLVNPAYVDSPAQALREHSASCTDEILQADVIVYFGGLTDLAECEGEDRAHMRLPKDQLAALEALRAYQKPVVLVLYTGSAVEIPDGMAAVLLMHLPGMCGGQATVSLLYGDVNPSGRICETWLYDAKQSYCDAQYQNDCVHDIYAESVYVGYRYYDAHSSRVRYPFGHGLSYTTFSYGDFEVSVQNDEIVARVCVSNTGERDGAEVVQLYVYNADCEVFRPKKELRAFAKVFVAAGKSERVTLRFPKSDLSYWNVKKHGFVLSEGQYVAALAKDAGQMLVSCPIFVSGERETCPYSQEVMQAYAKPCADSKAFAMLYGTLPTEPDRLPLSVESPLRDYKRTVLGKALWRAVAWVLDGMVKKAQGQAHTHQGLLKLKNAYFIRCMMPGASMRTVSGSSSGRLPMGLAKAIAWVCKGRRK